MSDTTTTSPSLSSLPPSPIPPPPTAGPAPTGNIVTDAFQAAANIGSIPCARNSLLGGIASGAGIGVIRGLSAGPMMAGHWAIATFTIVSLGSWHLCQKQMADERKKVTQVIESMPRRTVKKDDGSPDASNANLA